MRWSPPPSRTYCSRSTCWSCYRAACGPISDMYELLFAGIQNVLHAKYLVPLALGTLVGVIGGGLPGITNTMTVIMVLPFTFGLEPLQGLAAMIGVYVGGESGGLIASTLI